MVYWLQKYIANQIIHCILIHLENKKCKKKLSDSEITELMIKVCDTNTSNCQYIKQQISNVDSDSSEGILEPGDIIPKKCEVIPREIRRWINNILNFVRYVALALVIALGALDFMKAAGSGEPDAMKKAEQSFVKRVIAVAILFLVPVIVDFILNMINIYGVNPDNINCLK